MRLSLLPLIVLPLACGRQQQVAPVARLSPEREARCRALSDSVYENVLPERLPTARPSKPGLSGGLPRLPDAVPRGVPVRVNFLVRPDGSGDTSSVVITGTNDVRFRRETMRFVSGVKLLPAELEGCPVWSQATVVGVRTRG